MAKLIFGMNVSLDGYVDHEKFGPDDTLFRHFIDATRRQAGSIYGRGLYDVMRYWDDEHPDWDAPTRDFADAWRGQHKWVVSRSLTSVGPNATLINGDLATEIGALKERVEGEIDVGGPVLAHSLGQLGLIDAYRLYLHPVVLGGGSPFFTGPLPPLRLMETERIGEVIRLTYVPA